MKRASIFAALVSALAMTSAGTMQTQAQAATPYSAVDDDRSGSPDPDGASPDAALPSATLPSATLHGTTLPPLHLPTLVTALEDIGLVDPVLVGHDALAATLTFSARRPQIDVALSVTAELGVFIDVDITTGLLIERTA